MPDTPISLLERLRLRPDEQSWQRLVDLYTPLRAFRNRVLEGRRTAEAAAELGITANTLRIAKSRVLSRFRQEIDGIFD